MDGHILLPDSNPKIFVPGATKMAPRHVTEPGK